MSQRKKSNSFNYSELITLKNKDWLDKQLYAGECASKVLNECNKALSNSNVSLRNLEEVALNIINEYKCTPTFKNYRGFPSSICTSVNKQLVHGIVTDYKLEDGDLITVDVGVTFEGVIADTARTWIYKSPKDKKHEALIKAGKDVLDLAIKSVEVGKRLGIVGFTISNYIKKFNFGLITEYGGHGLDYNKPHADPYISNRSKEDEGARIVSGLTFAIEPMLTTGWDLSNQEVKTSVADDNWTVTTKYLSCHFEDTVTVFEDKIYRITNAD